MAMHVLVIGNSRQNYDHVKPEKKILLKKTKSFSSWANSRVSIGVIMERLWQPSFLQ